MADFKVHHIRFFDYQPQAIHCLAYNDEGKRLALSRADGSIEIWSISDNWFQEKLIPGSDDRSIEALVWCNGRLFSAGLQGTIVEYDLIKLAPKAACSSYGGAVWCLSKNKSGTQLAAGTEDGCVVLLTLTEDGPEYERSLTKQEGRILSIAWLESESKIITGGIDNIRIWSVVSGHPVQRLTLTRQDRNKETIVWCLAVTSDMTIISGDSTGKTCFWNGRQGTLIKSFQSHRADVLTLCVNSDGDSVYSCGVDPTLVQFEYVATQSESDWKMWVKSKIRTQHTHDVRALTIADNYVVTGGVDCHLIFNLLEKGKCLKHWRKIPPMPSTCLVQTAPTPHLIMLQYRDYLELWKLGSTNRSSDKNGTLLPLATNPIKLLQLKSRDSERIVCSALSPDGEWLAYSSTECIRLYSITIEEKELSPSISVHRVRYRPPGLQAAHRLVFTPDNNRLISAACDGTIQVTVVDSLQPSLVQTLTPPGDKIEEPVHLLALNKDGTLLATGDHTNNVHIYNLTNMEYKCSLPKYTSQPCALSFHPSQSVVAASYCDQKIVEYNFMENVYSDWYKRNSTKYHPQWLKRHSKITNIGYNPRNTDQLVLHDEQMICILDKTQAFPRSDSQLYSKGDWQNQSISQSKPHAFHISNKYKYILHLDVLDEDYLVVVEKTPMSLSEILPLTLKQKKFGT